MASSEITQNGYHQWLKVRMRRSQSYEYQKIDYNSHKQFVNFHDMSIRNAGGVITSTVIYKTR